MATDNLKLRWLVFIVAAAILLIFCQSFTFDFVNFDDPGYLTKNHMVANQNFYDIFTKRGEGDYVPLTLASFAIEFYFFGPNPLVFHTTNIILHLINCILVIFLLYRLSEKNITVTTLGALTFATCPLHVESVAWVTERKDVLYGLFFLSGLLSYLRYLEGHKLFYLGALIFLGLSLLSKPMAVTFPIILFLIDYLKSREFKILEKMPFLIIATLMGVFEYFMHLNSSHDSIQNSPALVVNNIFRSLFFYFSKFVWPSNLAAYYESQAVSLSAVEVALAVFFLTATVLFLLKSETKIRKSVIFGYLFFLICIAPTLHLAFYCKRFIFADRYFYIPGLGLIFLSSVMMNSLLTKKHNINFKIVLKYSMPVFILLGFVSYQRTKVWANSEVLWLDAMKKLPQSAFAVNILASHYMETGNLEKATKLLEMAVIKNPNPVILLNLGRTYLAAYSPAKAIKVFQEATKVGPPLADLHFALGYAFEQNGDHEMALKEYEESFKIRTMSGK